MTHPDRSVGRWRLDRRAFLVKGVTVAIVAPIAWGCAGRNASRTHRAATTRRGESTMATLTSPRPPAPAL